MKRTHSARGRVREPLRVFHKTKIRIALALHQREIAIGIQSIFHNSSARIFLLDQGAGEVVFVNESAQAETRQSWSVIFLHAR
jgi:hypothetical protein